MIWEVVLPKAIDKKVGALPKPERERVRNAINSLALGPWDCGMNVKQLHGRPEWRMRVGNWRVLFIVDRGKVAIMVVSFGPRGDVYKK